eukprot:gene3614-4499_t
MKSAVRVISTGSGYSDPSIMIWTPSQKYIFNLGNGVHRQNMGTQTKPYEANTIFLTHLEPSTMAGLPNYILRNRNDISIVGPGGLTHSVLAHRYYLARRTKSIYLTECTDEETLVLSDGFLQVYPIIIKPTTDNGATTTTSTSSSSSSTTLKSYPFVHSNYKNAMTSNNTYKFFEKMTSKTFFDWTVLRGGILGISSGSKFSTEELEHYMIYRLLDKEPNLEDKESLKPARFDEIEQFLMNHQDSGMFDDSVQDQLEEFWSLESRHYRLITRIPPYLRLNNAQKRKIARDRADVYVNDRLYGPIKSQNKTLPVPYRSQDSSPMGDIACYVCVLPDILGKFNNAKADELGVPKGPLRQKLCQGQSVKNSKGEDVHPDQVLSPSIKGPVTMVIACPRIEYLSGIVNNPCFKKWEEEGRSGCIVHMVPESIFSNEKYIEFVKSFNSGRWQHIILNESCSYHELTLKSGQMHHGLNLIAPTFFPPLYPPQTAKPLPESIQSIGNVYRGKHQQIIQLNPIALDSAPSINESLCNESPDSSFKFETSTPSPKPEIEYTEFQKQQIQLINSLSDKELEIVFLGTGCSQHSEFRDGKYF